ncbi:MAG: phosphodiester glycosidase family protein [Spirochaetota bacterium]
MKETLLPLSIIAAFVLFCYLLRNYWSRSKWFFRLVLVFATTILFLLSIFSGIGIWWYKLRGQPQAKQEQLFPGVWYYRTVHQIPRRIVLHIVKIDLKNNNLRFLVTPPNSTNKQDLLAQTTSTFLHKYKLNIAINGDYFSPWIYKSFWNYYPRSGDPVKPSGIAISNGKAYAHKILTPFSTLYIDKQQQLSLGQRPKTISQAISGQRLLLKDGKVNPILLGKDPHFSQIHPRTAIGLNQNNNTLFLLVADGRQPNYSMGLTGMEIVYFLQKYGATDIMNMDGGGSSTLVIQDQQGIERVLNTPLHFWPGIERPVANHLGVQILPP